MVYNTASSHTQLYYTTDIAMYIYSTKTRTSFISSWIHTIIYYIQCAADVLEYTIFYTHCAVYV